MGPNALLALQVLSASLTAIGEATTVAMQINAVISKARAEGRDISDAELTSIRSATDALEQKVLQELRS